MSVFAGIEDAKPNEGGNYILPGIYPVLYINACKQIKSQDNGDDLCIVELDIIDSKVEDREAGQSMSWIVNMKHQPALGNVKLFLSKVMDCELEDITGNVADAAFSTNNPLGGRLIRCEAIEITTRKKGNAFTKCNWAPIGKDLQENSAALHKAAGFGKDGPF